MPEILQIDGSVLEGGGQLTRIALSFAALTKKPVRIYNIRKNRPQSGLKAQHLHALKVLKRICDAKTSEFSIGTTEVAFWPRMLKGQNFYVDIGTAGAISLLLQNIILPAMFAKGKTSLTIQGGTDTFFAPTVDWMKHVFLPVIKKYCNTLEIVVERRGYYPKGGGLVKIEIVPKYSIESFNDFLKKFRKENLPIVMDSQGKFNEVFCISHASESLKEKQVAERQAKSASKVIKENLNLDVNVKIEYSKTLCPGSGILLYCYNSGSILGSDNLGKPGKPAEEVGKECAEKLLYEINSNAAVDKHLADNLIAFMALLPGSKIKTSEITMHTKTCIWLIEKFMDTKFNVSANFVESFV